MSHKKELLLRAYLVLAGLTIMALVLIGSTVRISVIQGAQWREKGDSTKLKFFEITPDRGNIYSADGYLLATSVPYFNIRLDLGSEAMTDAIFHRHVDSLSFYLAKHVFTGQAPHQVKRTLIRRRNAGDRYFLLKKNATYQQLTHIKTFPLLRLGGYRSGLIVERESRRLKPFKDLAFRTIGLDRDNAPSVGLEGSFESYLKGDAGRKLMQKVANKVWVPVNNFSEVKPKRGQDIVTTLDMRMQDFAHTALKGALIKHDADFGLAIIMDVSTGAMKAMANLKKQSEGRYAERFNHAVGDATEPGSTFKLASMMALLEDDMITLDDSVDINHGRAKFGKFIMKDAEWRKETMTTIRHAFEISSNVGIAKVVREKYGKGKDAELFIAKLRQFGLDQKTGIEIVGEGEPDIKEAFSDSWSRSMSLPWMAHGYELEVTPLQTLTFYNAVANGGRKMKPYLVDRVMEGTRVVKKFKPQVLIPRVASPATIDAARSLLEGVVTNGTAKRYQSDRYTFAGKSGTTKLEYWIQENHKYQASFVGYFPAEAPKYSCIVMVNNPKKEGYYGGTVAGAVFKEIADRCMATDRQLVQALADEPDLGPSALPLFEAGYSPDVKEVLHHLQMEHDDNTTSEWSVLMPSEGQGMAAENRLIKEEQVPNVQGMGLRDALFILENKGMTVKVSGYGKVRKQSVEPGTALTGQKILLFLG